MSAHVHGVYYSYLCIQTVCYIVMEPAEELTREEDITIDRCEPAAVLEV